ncbi:MAG: hypothetical protein R3F48_12505 [Candidatus Zixiibacteriota bacterium]
MNSRGLKNDSGFTILEILVGASLFFLGFSILVFLLSRMIVNYSIDDISTANRIASNYMETTIATRDTLSFTAFEIENNVKYQVEKTTQMDNSLACISIKVKRHSRIKVLSELYYEFSTAENK